MTRPIPALNPINTGSEMKLATQPKRKIAPETRITPTNNVSVAEAVTRKAVSALEAPFSRALAVKMANVVVVLTLSGREVPSAA